MINGINHISTLLAILLSFLPLFLYWRLKLAPDKTYLLVSIFWAITGISIIPDTMHWEWFQRAQDQLILSFNMIDTPLILFIFYYTFGWKIFKTLAFIFITFIAGMIAWKGYNYNADKYITNVGGLLILALNIWAIIRYYKKPNHTVKDNVMIYIFIGFIFYYALYFEMTFVYRFLRSSSSPIRYEAFSPYGMLVWYVVIILATAFVSWGFLKLGRPGRAK